MRPAAGSLRNRPGRSIRTSDVACIPHPPQKDREAAGVTNHSRHPGGLHGDPAMTASNPFPRAAAPASAPFPSTSACRSAARILATALCACTVALGLAGCGGGGGKKATIDTPAAQRAAISLAIQVARTAVDDLTAASTRTELGVAETLVAAAMTAVESADALSDEEKDAHDTTISVIEGNLDAKRMAIDAAERARRAEEAAKQVEALEAGNRITAIAAAVRHGAAPAMSGTVPGTPPTTVTDRRTTVEGSTSTEGPWTRGTYTAADEAAGTADEVVLYTDIEAPGMQPFSGEMGKYGSTDGIDSDGNLVIEAGTDATLIASSAFPTGPGIRTHMEGSGGMVEVSGTFDGVAGTYVCTPAQGNGCTSSIKAGGGIALAGGGGWKFVPMQGAMVPKPDSEYRYFGWWLRDVDESYAFGAFHAGVGDDEQDFAGLAAVQGRATYTGPAAGRFVIDPQIGDAAVGGFTASATLEVDFGDATAPGTVSGTVDRFMVDGDAMAWSVELQSARIGADGAIAADGGTVWSIDGRAGGTPGSPIWSGRLHDVGEDQVPNAATGMFESVFGDIGRMIGAFGATRQPDPGVQPANAP